MQSVRNVIDVVEALAADGESGVTDLARRTGIAKSTVQRCLVTLAAAGWIESAATSTNTAALTRWALSPDFRALARGTTDSDVRDIARPVMTELRDATGETVHLVGLEGSDIVLLERVAGLGPVQVVLPLGHRVPAHAGASGKALLAHLPTDELSKVLDRPLARLTDATVTDASSLRNELAVIRAQGWATNVGEWNAAVVAVSAPVLVHGRASVALSISSTPERLPADRMQGLGPLVADAAARIARRAPT